MAGDVYTERTYRPGTPNQPNFDFPKHTVHRYFDSGSQHSMYTANKLVTNHIQFQSRCRFFLFKLYFGLNFEPVI